MNIAMWSLGLSSFVFFSGKDGVLLAFRSPQRVT